MITPYVLIVFKFCGVLRPEGLSKWKKYLYSMYTTLVLVIMWTFLLSEVINFLLKTKEAIGEIAHNSFMLLTTICDISKIATLLKHRRDIFDTMNMLNNDICRPHNSEEKDIQNEFVRKMRHWILFSQTLVSTAVVAMTVSSFVSRRLPFSIWIPFNYTTFVGFWCAYVHQNIAHALSAFIGSSFDLFFCNLLNLACAQLNILKFRLRTLPTRVIDKSRNGNSNYERIQHLESNILTKSICHHLYIFKFSESVNKIFSAVIFIQCTVSTVVLCVSSYLISRMTPFSTEFTFLVVYVSCMLSQIFLYCWHGNEMMLESMDVGNAMYSMDWPLLNFATQKKLIMTMLRCLKPIKFTSGNIIVLSLETYTSLLKLSYSIYNLLQTSG